jgi:glycosyltransferase involved in cell wall biosynthesis
VPSLLVMMPAYNEAESVGAIVAEVKAAVPGAGVLVINDGSTDRTAAHARRAGAVVLDLPINLGIGGAEQAGFRYAAQRGVDTVVRIDADGQHPASEIAKLLDRLALPGARRQLVPCHAAAAPGHRLLRAPHRADHPAAHHRSDLRLPGGQSPRHPALCRSLPGGLS